MITSSRHQLRRWSAASLAGLALAAAASAPASARAAVQTATNPYGFAHAADNGNGAAAEAHWNSTGTGYHLRVEATGACESVCAERLGQGLAVAEVGRGGFTVGASGSARLTATVRVTGFAAAEPLFAPHDPRADLRFVWLQGEGARQLCDPVKLTAPGTYRLSCTATGLARSGKSGQRLLVAVHLEAEATRPTSLSAPRGVSATAVVDHITVES